jgi:creatinine amidohydrolase
MTYRALTAAVIVCLSFAVPTHGRQRDQRILKLDELTWRQVDALDRDRTMFILPIGMLEEHGPHLPIAADTFGVTFEATGTARRVSRALPPWTIVTMPPIEYGHAGANLVGGLVVHPGTYSIRQSTLRALVADLGAQVAQNGFKWLFVLTGHGAPPHSVAVNEACDFVSESFGITMLHVSGLFRADAAIQAKGKSMTAKHFSPAEIASFGIDLHAGVAETAAMLAVRPDLVDDSYRKLPALTGQTREEFWAIARTPGWQGYLSAPAKATAAYGRGVEAWWIEGMSDLILRAVAGENLLKAARAPDRVDPALEAVLGKATSADQAFETRLESWLASRRQQ